MSTMLHTVTEMFWMKSDACATKSRKKSHIPKSPKVQLWEPVRNHCGYLYFWDCGPPSRQSRPQVGAPIRRPPTQTRQSTAGCVRTARSRTRRWRSATYGHPVRHTPAVMTVVCFAWRCACALLTPWFLLKCMFFPESDGLESLSYPHGQSSTDIDEKLGTLEVDESWTLWGDARESNEGVDAGRFHMTLRNPFTCDTPRLFVSRLSVAVGLELDHNPPTLGGICSPGHRLWDQRSNSYWTCRTLGPLLSDQCRSEHRLRTNNVTICQAATIFSSSTTTALFNWQNLPPPVQYVATFISELTDGTAPTWCWGWAENMNNRKVQLQWQQDNIEKWKCSHEMLKHTWKQRHSPLFWCLNWSLLLSTYGASSYMYLPPACSCFLRGGIQAVVVSKA